MAARPSLDDYVDVAERIQDFKDAHKDGSLQTLGWEVVEVGNQKFVVYQAAAYRTAEDTRPGHGIAWEPFPGKTPYTANSELMNAETAAWGRAIVALGLVANRKLASRQEVRNRSEEQQQQPTGSEKPQAVKAKVKTLTPAQIAKLMEKVAPYEPAKVQLALNALGAADLPDLTAAQANELVKNLAA